MTSLFPPFNRRSSFRKQPYFYEAGRGVNYKSTGGPFPTLDLNFLSGTLDPRITFSRASNATLTDSTGKITYAPNNLALQSQTFDNASWVKTATTASADATTAPDGTTTADRIAEDATTASHNIQQSASFTAGVTYTMSVYVKKGSGATAPDIIQSTFNAGAFGTQYANFNISTGVVTASTGGTAAITAAGSGWYRISWTATCTTTGAGFILPISFCNNNPTSTRAPSYAGATTSDIFVWGAQLEAVTYQTTPSTYNATTTAAYYGPRFDYDPVTLAAKGLLIEEARTNLLTYSADFGTSGFPIATNVAVAADNTTSPDGTSNADRLTDDATSGSHRLYRDYTFTSAAAHTLSVYVKRNTHRWFRILAFDGTTSFWANFDLLNGVVGQKQAAVTSTITAVANGFYRVTLTATVAAAAGNIQMVMLDSDTTATPALYAGTGTSLWLYGVQLEAGAFATSYIPTVASSVARSADIATMTGTNFSSWFNQGPVNLLLQSQTLENASWSKTNTSISADSTTAPDGTTTADTLVENTVNGFHLASQVAGTVGNTETLSVYAKPAGRSWFVLQLGANAAAYFNVTTGALGNVTGGTASITSVGNGWYRCSVTGVRVTNQSNNILLASANGTSSYLGDGTSGVYLWGAQLEVGSTATTYIPTTTAPVANPPAVGTFVGSYSVIANTTTNQVLLRTDGSTGVSIRAVDGGGAGSRFLNSDTTLDISIATYPPANTTVKLGAAFGINDAAFSKNGSSPSTDTSYTNISAVTFMNIGCFSNSAWFINGCIQSIKYYNQRLPNAKLQALTV